MYYIYILHSAGSDKYYVGYSDAPHRRIEEHNTTERNTFTSKYRPWTLSAIFECSEDRGAAMRIERFIKRQKSRALIEMMINGDALSGILAQLVRVPYVRD